MEEVTDLDHQGAVIWTSCPLCKSAPNVNCASLFMLGQSLIIATVEPGKIHDDRMKIWIKLKSKVASESKSLRYLNLQQFPRKK